MTSTYEREEDGGMAEVAGFAETVPHKQ